MTYDYLTRTVHMPEKYFRKDRHVRLSKMENTIFYTMWLSKRGIGRLSDIYKRVYGDTNLTDQEKNNIARTVWRMRKKGLEIKPIYKYGYQLIEKD